MASAAPRNARRRPALSRERVLEAAIALADAGGPGRLTMRALAAALGVEAMSLYNHVRNKDDLIDAMVDAVVGGIRLPRPEGDWRDEMRARALSARAVFRAHPWALRLLVSRINVGPNMLRLIDATLGCLHAAGFGYPDADHVLAALDSQLYGFVLNEQSFPVAPGGYAEAARAYLPALPAQDYPHMRALAVLVAEGAHSGVNELAFGLDLLLDALDRLPRDREPGRAAP